MTWSLSSDDGMVMILPLSSTLERNGVVFGKLVRVAIDIVSLSLSLLFISLYSYVAKALLHSGCRFFLSLLLNRDTFDPLADDEGRHQLK